MPPSTEMFQIRPDEKVWSSVRLEDIKQIEYENGKVQLGKEDGIECKASNVQRWQAWKSLQQEKLEVINLINTDKMHHCFSMRKCVCALCFIITVPQ